MPDRTLPNDDMDALRNKIAQEVYEYVDAINELLSERPEGCTIKLKFHEDTAFPFHQRVSYRILLDNGLLIRGNAKPIADNRRLALEFAEELIDYEIKLGCAISRLNHALTPSTTFGLKVTVGSPLNFCEVEKFQDWSQKAIEIDRVLPRYFEIVLSTPFVRRRKASRLWLLGYPVHVNGKTFHRKSVAEIEVPPEIEVLKGTDNWTYEDFTLYLAPEEGGINFTERAHFVSSNLNVDPQ